jgi:hypothetical protein
MKDVIWQLGRLLSFFGLDVGATSTKLCSIFLQFGAWGKVVVKALR